MWTLRCAQPMPPKILLFTQSGCLNCEVMKIFLEAKRLAFEERNMTTDPQPAPNCSKRTTAAPPPPW